MGAKVEAVDPAAGTAEISSQLRDTIDAARERMRQDLADGVGGAAACRHLSDVYDRTVAELWERALAEVPAAADAGLSLVATGGWGRQELCPYSDIDFLLVARPDQGELAQGVADRLLYPLWDARVSVGHAVRDPRATAALATSDLPTATALLDARHIAGDPAASDELFRRTRRAIAPGGNANGFVAQLIAEKEKRYRRFGASLYLLEPNLKQGIGALRDLSTAVWAARARWGVTSVDELVPRGELTPRQLDVLLRGRDFLLELRCLLQLSADRITDQLTFEIQEAIAPTLFPDVRPPDGDVRPAVAPAVEALMRHYYLHARGIVRVADRLVESARVPARKKPRIVRIDGSFLVFNGKLAVRDPSVFRERPSEMLRIFRVALDHDLPIYGHTKELIEARVAETDGVLMNDRAAARHLLGALCDLRDARQPSLLEEMHQVGLLNAMMPEFAPCTCRVQHDLYHVYTVDQHQLYAVAMLKQTARGELADDSPIATEAARPITRPEPLFLGTLLHDVGKPLGKGHAEKGAVTAGAIARRLGLSEADAARTEFLVRQHLTMSHISQRRDLADPDVIQRFADRVGGEEALTQLYLLTRCDTAMTAPGNLTAWKDQLVTDLYLRAREHFRGGTGDAARDQAAHLGRARRRVVEILSADAGDDDGARSVREAEVRELLDQLDDRFVNGLTPRQLARHVRLAESYPTAGRRALANVTAYPLKGHSELAVVARDTPGLLADLAGVLAAHRVDIDGAVVTTAGGVVPGETLALDLFYVRNPQGRSIPADDPRWEKIERDIEDVLGRADTGERVEALIDRRRSQSNLAPRVTPGVPTSVQVLNDASAELTVVEVFTQDRVGVLHTITRVLAESGLDIRLSKVSTEGEKVADAFYVADRGTGAKITETPRVHALERRLLEALAEEDD